MIRQLRHKTVGLIMTVLMLLILLTNVIVHLSAVHACNQMCFQILQALAENEESFRENKEIRIQQSPIPGTLTISQEELLSIAAMPLYAAELTPDGQLTFFGNYQSRTPLAPAAMSEALDVIARREYGSGRIGTLRYYKAAAPTGAFVTLSDSSLGFERTFILRLTTAAVVVSIPLILVLALVSVLLSRFALAPAEEAFRKQKQFISDAGHELKTPLSTISVNVSVLESETGPSRAMDCIKAETRRMDVLVRQMLEVACVEGGGDATIRRERFSMSDVVYQATLPFESLAFEQNLQYTATIQEDCFFTGDAELIRHIMSILLDNAFKYVCPQGDIAVSLRREGRRLVIEVFNTGQGISPADLPHIFQRFYRCDKARPGNGSYGLGLAIAQAAVRSCGGTIRAESDYGHWASFRVTL